MTRLSTLTAATTVASTDIFLLANDPSGTNLEKKITASNLFLPLTLDQTNSRLGINTTVPAQRLHITNGNIRMDQVAGAGAPTVATGAAGVLTGAYQYAITFATALGETAVIIGNLSSVVNPSAQQVSLSNIPVSVDPNVTSRKVYRTTAGGSFNTLKLVATIANNTATTFSDNIADGSLTTIMPWRNSTGSGILVSTNPVMQVDTQFTGLGINAGGSAGRGGYQSVAVGSAALSSITTGIQNVALGFSALSNLTTGQGNMGIGYAALEGVTTGSANVGIGADASQYNQTGSSNTFVGSNAGFGVISNSYSRNTGLGARSGVALTTGNNNVLIGYQSADTLTTGNNNLIVGYDIDMPAVGTSNFMSIGNLIFSTAIDGTGTTLSSGNIGVGIAAPVTKFHTVLTNTDTNVVAIVGTFGHNSTNTVANNFGTALLLQGQTDSTPNANMLRIRSQWATATHGSRKAKAVLGVYDTAERDVIGIGTDGAAGLLGFYPTISASPIAQPTTGIAAATFVANTSAITNDTATFDGYTIGQVVKALRNLGLLT